MQTATDNSPHTRNLTPFKIMFRQLERRLVVGSHDSNPMERTKTQQALDYSICTALVVLLGYIDCLTGITILIFGFYLIPIRLAAVRLGMVGGIAISMLATLAWSLSDYLAGESYSNQLITIWNVMVRFLSFLVVAWLSARNVALFAEERATSDRLRKALSKMELIESLLPICVSCKNIRDEKGQWNVLERYVQEHTPAKFSNDICPHCALQLARDEEDYIESLC